MGAPVGEADCAGPTCLGNFIPTVLTAHPCTRLCPFTGTDSVNALYTPVHSRVVVMLALCSHSQETVEAARESMSSDSKSHHFSMLPYLLTFPQQVHVLWEGGDLREVKEWEREIYDLTMCRFLPRPHTLCSEETSPNPSSYCISFFLLRYNSHTVKFTVLKCTVRWFLVYSQGCAITTTDYRTFPLSNF